jgi:hypothetical protein
MRINRSLDLICLRGMRTPGRRQPEISTLPSWVPNYPNIWSNGMTIQEMRFSEWQTSFKSHPILDGSRNNFLKVEGCHIANVKAITSALRSSGYEDKDTEPYWMQPNSIPIFPFEDARRGYDAIWRGLTMSLLPETSPDICRSCLSVLWMPEGRGAVSSLAMIEWLDRNFSFRYIRWTLQEWSRGFVVRPNGHTPEQLNKFISTIHKVLSNGMRLAVVEVLHSNTTRLAMVGSEVQTGDRIYWLPACSKPVTLQANKASTSDSSYRVTGVAYLCDEEDFHGPGMNPMTQDYIDGCGPLEKLTLR